ncbi:hypothetical protein M1145_02975, partial [Patescibacteria group bacterium]|nr:hypothetical protein [Patescibacteria group bacterium]
MNEVLKNPQKEDELSNTVGEWVIYEQGGDHAPLVESLGNKTRWSVEDPSKAKYQLKIGDIIVYYTGPKRIPRALIRMESNHIADVIGVAEDQNLDPYIEDIVSRKLKEFGEEGESYKTKVSDMKRVTGICDRVNKGGDLDSEDLRFLYEIDRTIQGFEYSRDPRINTLLEGRDIK